jgi:transketolase
MRRAFASELLTIMRADPRVVLLTADVGYGMFDAIRDEFAAVCRFHNVGAAEQAMIGMGAGLALAGKIPFCYSITPFLLYRPYELIRNYVNHESIPVRLVGGGRDRDYSHDGFTHHAEDAHQVLDGWPNIRQYWPECPGDVHRAVQEMARENGPSFISLRR